MKIHNTEELVKRATFHRRHDRVAQRTYGRMSYRSLSPLPKFQGCAIGCLGNSCSAVNPLKLWSRATFTAEGLRDNLETEFGITRNLVYVAEGFFEAQRGPRQARNFVLGFAEALPEGAEISDLAVKKFVGEKLGLRHWPNSLPNWSWNEIADTLKANRRKGGDAEVEELTEALFQWLRDQAPKPGPDEVLEAIEGIEPSA